MDVRLRADDFYREQHRSIFRGIMSLHEKNEAVDPLTVCAELEERGELANAGGKPYVHQLAAAVPTAGNARHYAQLVKEQSTMRRLLDVAQKIQIKVHDRRGEPREMVEDAERMLFEVAHSESPATSARSTRSSTRRSTSSRRSRATGRRSPARPPATRSSTTSPAASSGRT